VGARFSNNLLENKIKFIRMFPLKIEFESVAEIPLKNQINVDLSYLMCLLK
jgi:hypothetical protein